MVHTDFEKKGDVIILHIDSNSCLNLISFVLDKESYIHTVLEYSYHEQSSLFEDHVVNVSVNLNDLQKIETELKKVNTLKIDSIELGENEEQPIITYNQLTNLINKLIKRFILKSQWARLSN